MTGARLVAEERLRHILTGKTAFYDVKTHKAGALTVAAIAILAKKPENFPSTWSAEDAEALTVKNIMERTCLAAAFLCAEMDCFLLSQNEMAVTAPTKHLTFGEAVELLKTGRRLSRRAWLLDDETFLQLVGSGEVTVGDEPFPSLPFILQKTADNKVVPWVPAQTDLLAEDWQLLETNPSIINPES